jgi:6-phosphofructokinase
MNNKTEKIAILTSGGDCPGLNAALRALVLRSHRLGIDVIGLKNGLFGLMNEPWDIVPLSLHNVSNFLMYQGGSFLGSTSHHAHRQMHLDDSITISLLKKNYQTLELSGIIAVGGDGSTRIISHICKLSDIPLVMIPKTIDQDLSGTDSIGHATAVEVATQALENLFTTGHSHDRIMILEVMGRDVGHIALSAGIAGGADIILIPEISYNFDHICFKIQEILNEKKTVLIIVSEATLTPDGENSKNPHSNRYGGVGHSLANHINTRIPNVEARATVLGHIQRGARPCAFDKMIATILGTYAVDALINKKNQVMVTWSNSKITLKSVEDVLVPHQITKDHLLIQTCEKLGIYVGRIEE